MIIRVTGNVQHGHARRLEAVTEFPGVGVLDIKSSRL